MVTEINREKSAKEQANAFGAIIGKSEQMMAAVKLARKGALTDVSILLEGESGVGKEVFARAIHKGSKRAEKPVIVVNCGALPVNLVESILFGHAKGAFTDAKDDHSGKFIDADGGTIFLDEIGELPLDLQVKLLRVLQEGEVDPVGSASTVKVDVRVISPTNKKLETLIRSGAFREDLYYRLNVFPVPIPPLNKRADDIQLLTNYFISEVCKREIHPVKKIDDQCHHAA